MYIFKQMHFLILKCILKPELYFKMFRGINISPALRVLIAHEGCVDSGLTFLRSAQDWAPVLGKIWGEQPGGFKPLPAAVPVPFSLSTLLNYTSDGEQIIFSSGWITSAESRRRAQGFYSVPLKAWAMGDWIVACALQKYSKEWGPKLEQPCAPLLAVPINRLLEKEQ